MSTKSDSEWTDDHEDRSIHRRTNRWPKQLPELTAEQARIQDDFVRHWLEVLPQSRFGLIEKFNHGYPLRTFAPGQTTLEIGAGLGAHLPLEQLDKQNYVALELRSELADSIRASWPSIGVAVGDCQERLGFPDGHFDRILAIHVLEHLPDLPRALDQIYRVLRPGGHLSVVIPCEGGLAYSIARNISARRIFEKRYKQSYDWLISREHINRPEEIIAELSSRFSITHRSYWPLRVPFINLNLAIGLTLVRD